MRSNFGNNIASIFASFRVNLFLGLLFVRFIGCYDNSILRVATLCALLSTGLLRMIVVITPLYLLFHRSLRMIHILTCCFNCFSVLRNDIIVPIPITVIAILIMHCNHHSSKSHQFIPLNSMLPQISPTLGMDSYIFTKYDWYVFIRGSRLVFVDFLLIISIWMFREANI